MSKKLAYERYCWFHGRVKGGRSPNAVHLSRKFEISEKQARRDIAFMRDRLEVPLEYNPSNRGYYYSNPSYELPPVWIKEEELLSLCMALRLAATLPDRGIKQALNHIYERFITFRFIGSPPSLNEINNRISVKNIQYYRVDEDIFHTVSVALFNDKALKISYFTPHKQEMTERVIQPLHLLCYMGSWHIIAFCSLRREIRDFALSRIRAIAYSARPVSIPKTIPSIKDYLRINFGLMTGGTAVQVVLKFAPNISGWISEQVWHSSQETSIAADGSIELRFPVTDFRELKREILKFGASVEVLSPEELRHEMKNEIERMKKIYT